MADRNVLIDYSKWLFKWFVVLLLLIGGVAFGLFYFEGYRNELVPMTSLRCDLEYSYDTEQNEPGDTNSYFLIQKRRVSEFPEGLYRSVAIRSGEVTNKTDYKDLALINSYREAKNNLYIFSDNSELEVEIDREKLTMEVKRSNPSDSSEVKLFYKLKCEKVGHDEFFNDSRAKILKVKESRAF